MVSHVPKYVTKREGVEDCPRRMECNRNRGRRNIHTNLQNRKEGLSSPPPPLQDFCLAVLFILASYWLILYLDEMI